MKLQRVVSPIIGARSPIEEQPVLLSTEPSLRSFFLFFLNLLDLFCVYVCHGTL